jgi:hypothetical protein
MLRTKKKFSSIPVFYNKLILMTKVDSWVLVYNNYGKGRK